MRRKKSFRFFGSVRPKKRLARTVSRTVSRKKTARKPRPFRPWRKDIYLAVSGIILTLAALPYAFKLPISKNPDYTGTLAVLVIAAVIFYITLNKIQSAYFRLNGKWTEWLSFIKLKMICPGWTVNNSVMLPHPFRGDVDIIVEKGRKKAVVEVKSAVTTWGLENEEFYRWNEKADKALKQTAKAAKAMSAFPVLWLPLCRHNMTVHRNGILVVAGSSWRMKRALKKNGF